MTWLRLHWRWVVLAAALVAAGVIGLVLGDKVVAAFVALLGGGALASDRLERMAWDRHARARRQASSDMIASAGRAATRVTSADKAAKESIDAERSAGGGLGGWIRDRNRQGGPPDEGASA